MVNNCKILQQVCLIFVLIYIEVLEQNNTGYQNKFHYKIHTQTYAILISHTGPSRELATDNYVYFWLGILPKYISFVKCATARTDLKLEHSKGLPFVLLSLIIPFSINKIFL